MFQTQRQQSTEAADWLLSGWITPAPRLVRRQVRQAALRTQTTSSDDVVLAFDRTNQGEIDEVRPLHSHVPCTSDIHNRSLPMFRLLAPATSLPTAAGEWSLG